MHWILNNILYIWVGFIGIYIITSSYFLSKILVKLGKSEIYWFFLLNAFYPFLLGYVLLHPTHKKNLVRKEKNIIIVSILVLFVLVLSILIPILINLNGIESSNANNNKVESILEKITIPGVSFPDWFLSVLLILVPFYYVFVAFWVSTIMKSLDNGRSWFYSLLFFHIFILLYIFANQRYRNKLSLNEKIQVVVLGMGYFVCALIAKNAIDV